MYIPGYEQIIYYKVIFFQKCPYLTLGVIFTVYIKDHTTTRIPILERSNIPNSINLSRLEYSVYPKWVIPEVSKSSLRAF